MAAICVSPMFEALSWNIKRFLCFILALAMSELTSIFRQFTRFKSLFLYE